MSVFLFSLLKCAWLAYTLQIEEARTRSMAIRSFSVTRDLLGLPRHIPFSSSLPFHSRQVSYLPRKTVVKYNICNIHNEMISDAKTSSRQDVSSKNWKIKMLYDGDCPLCMREVNMLKERNKVYGAIKFVDISSSDYSPEDNQQLDYETAMGRIHAILSDGTVVRDVEVFRRLYEAVGLGWVYAITKYEPVATIASAVYSVWAKYRLQVTGRPSLEVILEARKNKGEMCKDSKACDL